MDGRSVEVLVRQCQLAHPPHTYAFELLVTQYQPRVFALALHLLGNYHDAEDQTQEVFLKVFRNIRGLEHPATFPAWLRTITVNTCRDALSRQHRRSDISLTWGNESAETQPALCIPLMSTPEERTLSNELRGHITATLADLRDSCREILVMRMVEGCSYAEIAANLGIGLSAAKMRVHRARRIFGHQLAQTYPESIVPRYSSAKGDSYQ
ncbi:MAG: RNA polymerase sigma factor [Kouleothrix sp.]